MALYPHTLQTPQTGLPRRKRILIADPQPQFMDGLRAMVTGEVDMEVVAHATDEAALVRKLDAQPADVLVISATLGGATAPEMLERLVKRYPRLPILVLVEDQTLPDLQRLARAGAHGLVQQEASRSELISALRALHRGQRFFGLSVQQELFTLLRNPHDAAAHAAPAQPAASRLTDREVDILELLAEGLTSTQIASRLCLSPRTVDTHRKNMLRKTGTNNVAGLIRYGLTYGIL